MTLLDYIALAWLITAVVVGVVMYSFLALAARADEQANTLLRRIKGEEQ